MAAHDRLPHRRSEAVLCEVEDDELVFHFLAGRPSLDLVATIGERWGRGFERLREPADLARWPVEAGLLPAPPRVTRPDLEAARRLRGAIARTAFAWADGLEGDAADLAVVNTTAGAPDLALALTADHRRVVAEGGTIRNVLSTVARDVIDLVATGDPDRLRECAAEDCSLLFHDASRPGARRWCSMAACGNRDKTASYRRRVATR